MRWSLVVLAFTGLAVVLATVVTREPNEPLAIAFVTTGAALAVGATVARVLLAFTPSGSRRSRPSMALALRRGTGLGVMVGSLLFLRVIDGLTLITAAFVVLAFVLAETVLSARTT